MELVDEARIYDNTEAARPLRLVASCVSGYRVSAQPWPAWTPEVLREAGR